ncbi:M20/M25/M40 family metallo-hydrolase [Candidatus Amarobacter glycogenicus]|uniref:M20/M25/M40 family metallo-hydrolase n=1 Tax=Candidatus Amarobacter glycogenicus TaxID=3140699 RepID=UPI002A0F2C3D|nr:M20/M25/M40 family metallo-hydrolase [Dehalococcoidia bacterium]MBK9611842.1 M20/M25/M40 family metallo-hydrolase [Dehalococcoidia bacterium]
MTASIDWDAATAEAVSLLREYLRIDTSNPPGNERPAVEFLRGILAAEGIPSEVAESAPGRSNLFARLGPPSGGVCLLNHTDVVPVERQFWARDPFSGDLVDGMVWGRGALDMKGMGILELMVFLLLRRTGVPLAESVSFLAVADEEAGSAFGASWVAENRPAWMDTGLVINEGAYGLALPGGPQVFQIAPTEKVPLWVRLTVHGRPGHGSVPHGDNCAEHLVQALERITRWQRELRILPVMKEHARALTGAGVMRSAADDAILRAANRNPSLRARLSNTVAVTTINTGIKVNVIPAEATATLDCRLLPDVDADVFLAELSAVIADSRVELAIENRFVGAESPLDTRFASVVRDVIADMAEGAYIAPEMTSGFTDSRIYRLKGIPAYGFVPCLVPPEELGGVHGHNERISVENIRLGLQVLYEVVRRLVASP